MWLWLFLHMQWLSEIREGTRELNRYTCVTGPPVLTDVLN